MDEREPELIDYLRVIWRWKWLIVLISGASLAAAAIITWRTVPTYRMAATIDVGDLGEERAKDVERLVARLNAAAAWREGRRLTAQYRKPFLVDLEVDTPSPRDAVQMIQATAGELVRDLRELLRLQRGEEEAKLETIRTQIEAAEREAAAAVAQLRIDVDRQLASTKARLDRTTAKSELLLLNVKAGIGAAIDAARGRARAAKLELENVKIEQAMLERRREALHARLERLRQVAGESSWENVELAGVIGKEESTLAEVELRLTVRLPAEAAALAQAQRLLDEQVNILEGARAGLNFARKPAVWQEVEQAQEAVYRAAGPASQEARWLERLADKLGEEVPVALRQLETERQTLAEQLKAWEAAAVVLREPGHSAKGNALDKVREAIYRVAAPGSPSVAFVDSTVRKVVVDLPEKLRTLGQEADALERRTAGIRSATLIAPPELPRAPVRPRVALNLALGLAAGLAGSVLMAFFLEYLRQHR